MKKIDLKKLKEFVRESNAIESVYDEQSFKDAMSAWNFLKTKKYLTPETILEVHRKIMRKLRPDIAGWWRNCDVWIGGKCKGFISVSLIKEDVSNFCQYLTLSSQNDIVSPEMIIKNTHIRFENIHPFEDGNGRVGRLIMLWHRIQYGLPIEVIHADYDIGGEEQKNYYKWFR